LGKEIFEIYSLFKLEDIKNVTKIKIKGVITEVIGLPIILSKIKILRMIKMIVAFLSTKLFPIKIINWLKIAIKKIKFLKISGMPLKEKIANKL
jgi:hypothetical protein